METIKSYTDVEQSKKLAEILPLESADMRFCFSHTLGGRITGHYPMIGREPSMGTIPCWSLSALISVLPIIENYYAEIRCVNNRFCCCYTHKQHIGDLYWHYAGNPVDACYEMILKLKEKNLL